MDQKDLVERRRYERRIQDACLAKMVIPDRRESDEERRIQDRIIRDMPDVIEEEIMEEING